MSLVQYAVRQDNMFVAKIDASEIDGEDKALREAMHYLAVYSQDGPAEIWRRSKHRKWKPMGLCMGVHPDQPA